MVNRTEIHKMDVRITNSKDPYQTASLEAVWLCTVCLGLFVRQLTFEILEHLLYSQSTQMHG